MMMEILCGNHNYKNILNINSDLSMKFASANFKMNTVKSVHQFAADMDKLIYTTVMQHVGDLPGKK